MISSLYLKSAIAANDAAPKLRVGVMLDGENLEQVVAAIIQNLRDANFIELALLVFNGENTEGAGLSETRPHSFAHAAMRRLVDPVLRRRLLYDLYEKLDSRRAEQTQDHPLHVADCSTLLKGVDRIVVVPIRKGFVHRFPPDAIDAIRQRKLDVLLRFGFNILRGDILDCARYGVWSYHHGDNEYYRGGPPLFWEVLEGNPISGVVLQRLTSDLDGGLILCKALFRTDESLLVSKNRYSPYWDSAHFVIWKLNELHTHGWEYVRDRAVPDIPYKGKRKIYRVPGNADMLRWLAPNAPKALAKVLTKRFNKKVLHWRIAIRAGATPLYRPDGDLRMSGFKFVESPKGHYWADPFLFERAGVTYVFFEDYLYQAGRGVISYAEIGPDAKPGPSRVCLDTGAHLSYPMIFEHEGEVYMIPESADTLEVVLYRAKKFPDVWVREKVLLKGVSAVDTTVHKKDGLWWFFTTLSERDGVAKGMLFYSDSLTGDWRAHPQNPISADVRNARSAGRVIECGQQLLRLSQNCGPAYGFSFAFNDVLKLDKTSFEERVYRTIDPSWSKDLIATHTYNSCPGLEVIDACALRPEAVCF